MKIVILSIWYSENMGYIENCFPKSLSKLGHEVHVITSQAQVYFNNEDYDGIYRSYLGPPIVPTITKMTNGYTLHRLRFKTLLGKIYLNGLAEKIKQIKPDIIQTFDSPNLIVLQAAIFKYRSGFRLFIGAENVYSVFPSLRKDSGKWGAKLSFIATRALLGILVSSSAEKCYAFAPDAKELAVKYYRIQPEKITLLPLGVDTDSFKPAIHNQKERHNLRQLFGFVDNDIVCIYTGRFTNDKNPLCLAEAIDKLVKNGEPYKAFFVGNGPQFDKIKSMQGCTVHNFVPYQKLPKYYAIADIGVWPCQESTSMIDAAACGLPIIISNKVQATERVEGNGFTYIENDSDHLVEVILKMKNVEVRKQLGDFGITKTLNNYSWDKLAQDRIKDYKLFVR